MRRTTSTFSSDIASSVSPAQAGVGRPETKTATGHRLSRSQREKIGATGLGRGDTSGVRRRYPYLLVPLGFAITTWFLVVVAAATGASLPDSSWVFIAAGSCSSASALPGSSHAAPGQPTPSDS